MCKDSYHNSSGFIYVRALGTRTHFDWIQVTDYHCNSPLDNHSFIDIPLRSPIPLERRTICDAHGHNKYALLATFFALEHCLWATEKHVCEEAALRKIARATQKLAFILSCYTFGEFARCFQRALECSFKTAPGQVMENKHGDVIVWFIPKTPLLPKGLPEQPGSTLGGRGALGTNHVIRLRQSFSTTRSGALLKECTESTT